MIHSAAQVSISVSYPRVVLKRYYVAPVRFVTRLMFLVTIMSPCAVCLGPAIFCFPASTNMTCLQVQCYVLGGLLDCALAG